MRRENRKPTRREWAVITSRRPVVQRVSRRTKGESSGEKRVRGAHIEEPVTPGLQAIADTQPVKEQ